MQPEDMNWIQLILDMRQLKGFQKTVMKLLLKVCNLTISDLRKILLHVVRS